MELTHYRIGTVYCASPSAACNGGGLYGHEQRYGSGDGRDKEDA